MRIRGLTIVFATAVILSATIPVFGLDDATWIRTYRGGYGHSVYETADGGAILGGTFGAGGVCCQPWLLRLAPDGSVRWHRTYESPGLAGANNIVPTSDGGYLLSGEGTEIRLVKVDAEGNVLWGKEYGDGGYTNLRVLEAADGNILLTGATFLGEPGSKTNGRALLLDPDGNVLWQKIYGQPGAIDYFTTATQAYNGNYIVVGSSRGLYWVMELDRGNGDIVWQSNYGGDREDTPLAVTQGLKNRYIVVGASDTFAGEGLRNLWILILSKSGRVMKELALLDAPDAEDPHSVIATSDGGFLVGGGTGSFGSGFSDIWLVKFDSHARVEWQKTYGMPNRTDHAWQIQETDTGYVVIGDSYSFPVEYEVWLMTLDKTGNVAGGDCGVIGDSTAYAWPTQALVSGPSEAVATDTDLRTNRFKVGIVDQTWPPEVCEPFPVSD